MNTDRKNVFTVVAHTVVMKNDGSLSAWGDNGSGQLGDWDNNNQISTNADQLISVL